MSIMNEPELFVRPVVKESLSHLEDMVGCKKGALNSIYSPVDYKESLQCYSRLRGIFNTIERKYYAGRLSIGLALTGIASAAVLNSNLTDPVFNAGQMGALNTFCLIAAGVGGGVAVGLRRDERYHRQRFDREISEFRERLPAPLLK